MNAIGKIALFMPEIYDSLDYELLDGIYSQARKLGYDVLVFTGAFNSRQDLQQDDYIFATENIYEMVNRGDFDGILFLASNFHNTGVRARIYDFLDTASAPVLVMGQETQRYPYIFQEQRESIKMLTRHLIVQHNRRRLCCLTGLPDEPVSNERLAGFWEAVFEAGIPREDCSVFYGEFWEEKPRLLAEKIADGTFPRPDAIVAASDIMAVALCKALTEKNISVPDDIAVTGYDGTWYAHFCTPEITTIYGREFQYGATAVCRLYEMMTGKQAERLPSPQQFRFGTSCGCAPEEHFAEKQRDTALQDYVRSQLEYHNIKKTTMASDFLRNISKVGTLRELVTGIDNFGHLLRAWEWLDICLCEDWCCRMDNMELFREHGFSKRMLSALSKRANINEKDGFFFPTHDILPALGKAHEPKIILFTSLHSGKQIFGYFATAYNKASDIHLDNDYLSWCDTVSCGIQNLQLSLHRAYIARQIEDFSEIEPKTGLYNKCGFAERLPEFLSICGDFGSIMLMLAFSGDEEVISTINVETAVFISNVLKYSSESTELSARLAENVFVILMPKKPNETVEQTAEKRIMALEKRARYMQGGISTVGLPELITVCAECPSTNSDAVQEASERLLEVIIGKAASAANRASGYREQLCRLRRDIYLTPESDWNLATIQKKLGISRSHLQRMYKTYFFVSCMEDIINARMEKAAHLLMHSDLRIQEIAVQCGYNNAGHFMRQFKERKGVTALQFRKNDV